MAKRLASKIPDKFGGAINAQVLASYVRRAAAVMDEQAEADAAGIASKREIRHLARESRMEPEVLQAQLKRMVDLRAALGKFITTPLGGYAAEHEEAESGRRADTMAEALRGANGSGNGRKRKPFAAQPIGGRSRRSPGPPRGNGAAAPSVDDALARARGHLGGDDDPGPELPPAA